MPMKEVTLEYIKARLTALGFTEDDIKKGIEAAVAGAGTGNARYFHKMGFTETIIKMDFGTGLWFMQEGTEKFPMVK